MNRYKKPAIVSEGGSTVSKTVQSQLGRVGHPGCVFTRRAAHLLDVRLTQASSTFQVIFGRENLRQFASHLLGLLNL